ncbi:MAG TPA: A/G-specific adenine glycosylase [Terriglobales bacterium]|nr:A/G-specific adenine glycosylase [Terriglobales bacterium]
MPLALADFRRRLLRWYDRHARALPWRGTRDPYRVWLSEVMLQQTRVAAVLGHYRDFLRRFPTLRALAAANERDVLAAWSGLGYYRRARLLHRAAQVVAREHGANMPRSAKGLRGLPGVGRYTAAAIASIAFGEPVAVVDGNVERVLARLAGRALPPAETWLRAQELLAPRRAGDFNQAMMELGATVCLPDKPLCGRCPVAAACATRGELPRAASRPRRKQEVAYALARRNGSVRLVQRNANASLMPGMWELPACTANGAPALMRLRHAITVTDYTVVVFEEPSRAGRWVEISRLSELPLTGLTRKILKRAGML